MRPRKIVLLFHPDETALSVLSYTLYIAGYNVLSAQTVDDAARAFLSVPSIDLVLASHNGGLSLIPQLKAIAAHIPMILLGGDRNELHGADCMLSKRVTMTELLERIKVMTARKRGPKKKGVVQVWAEPVAEVAVA